MTYSPCWFVTAVRLAPATDTRASGIGCWSALETTLPRMVPSACAWAERGAAPHNPASVVRTTTNGRAMARMLLSRAYRSHTETLEGEKGLTCCEDATGKGEVGAKTPRLPRRSPWPARSRASTARSGGRGRAGRPIEQWTPETVLATAI